MAKLRDLMYQKRVKQIELVRLLGVDPGRVSLHVNGIRPLPKKYHQKMAEFLGVPQEEITKEMKQKDHQ